MEDSLFLIVVGNDVAAECDVTNAILSYRNTIKQFKLRNLTVKKVFNSATITNKLTIAIAPTIGTKAWEKARWRIKFLSQNHVLALLYISKVGNFVVDDARFIREIRSFFGPNLHVASVLYHNENNDKDATQKCHKLKDACDGNMVCIKSTLLKRHKSDLAKQAIRVISNCIILNNKSKFPWWIKYRTDILLKRATVTSTEKPTPSKYEETAPERYTDVRTRLETFETWPSEIMLAPPLLAAAGFFYTGVDDECVCFSCNVCVRKWNALHDPWLEHIRWFPMCSYLKRIWGEKDVVETHRTLKITDAFIKDKQSATKDAIDETAPTPRTDERQLERAKTPDNVKVVLHDEHWKLYLRTLQFGTVASRHVRVNVVGHQSVGKTTLVKRLQNMPIVCPDNLLPPTEGLDIEQVMSRVLDIGDGKRFWETQTQGYDRELNYERMAWAISEYSIAEDIPKEIHHLVFIAHESKERDHNETTTGTQTNPAAKGKESSITETKFQTREYDLSDYDLSDYMIGSEEIVEEGTISNACSASYNKSREDGLRTYSLTAESEQYLKQVVRKMQFSPGERIYLTYWDFAGQTTYYTTHQAFMSPSVVYLLVIDLNKPLNDVIHENLAFSRSARTENTEDVSVLDTIRFWWDSIKTYGNDDNTPVIVVGTHSDMVDEKTIEKIFERIKNVMQVGSLQCIAINNTLSASDDDTLTELKNKIIDEGLGVTDQKIPASWFALEFRLLRIKSEDRNKITMSVEEELRHIDSTSDVPLNDIARLKNFLEYQHYKGFLMYFQEPGLDNLILLDPMALVKFINIIMRRKPKDSYPLSLRVKNDGWNSDGILDEKFILTAVENETNGFKENVETIIKILIHLKIIFQKYDHQETKVFFMPCLLPKRSQDVPLMASSKECQKTPRIKISFERGIIPPPVFHSLIASLLSEWNPQTINDSVSIFYNYACFCIKGEIGLLEMVWKDSSIYLYVISFLKTDSLKDLRGDECINTIKRHLELISKTYKRHLPDCDVRVCCPEHNIPPSFVSLKHLLVNHCATVTQETHMQLQRKVYWGLGITLLR